VLQQDTYDYIITNQCLPGDILLFDRKCERCCTSPWAALSCSIAKSLLCRNMSGQTRNDLSSTTDSSYDHIGIIVPGYIHSKKDQYDPLNLLLLEATTSGIVARPLKERIEQSASRSILLLQLNCPGEERHQKSSSSSSTTTNDMEPMMKKDMINKNKKNQNMEKNQSVDSRQISVQRTRDYINQELVKFRDTWITMSHQRSYSYIHNTIVMGGALLYATGMNQYYKTGLISPSAYIVLCALQKAFIAPSYHDSENHAIKVEDYLRDCRVVEQNAIRLRPGYRYLTPIPIKDQTRSI
jgi:hypothetical protein